MIPGDVINTAIWVTGEEAPEIRAQYEKDVTEAIYYLCYENGFLHGPVTFSETHPMGETMPVPDHIQGARVRLLVGEATITGKVVLTSKGSFVMNLDKKDLKKLRRLTREAKYQGLKLTNRECDEIIDQIGPEAALDTLRLH